MHVSIQWGVCMSEDACVLLHVSTCILIHAGCVWTLISAAAVARCLVMYCSLSLTQYPVRSCLQPHLSPSGDSRGYDSPKRNTFLVDLHTWCLGGRGTLAGTLSCRWLPADRPCSPTPRLSLYRSGTCTRHSVPRLLGNVAWHVPHWCRQFAEWTVRAKASLILLSVWFLWKPPFFFCCFFFFFRVAYAFAAAALSQRWQYHWEVSKWTATLNGALKDWGTVAACCYFCVTSLGQRLAPIQLFRLRLPPLAPGWWGVSTSELLRKRCGRSRRGQLTVRRDGRRGVALLISQWPTDVSAWSPVSCVAFFRHKQHPKGQKERKKKRVRWIK